MVVNHMNAWKPSRIGATSTSFQCMVDLIEVLALADDHAGKLPVQSVNLVQGIVRYHLLQLLSVKLIDQLCNCQILKHNERSQHQKDSSSA